MVRQEKESTEVVGRAEKNVRRFMELEMTITEARKLLTKPEMDRLTEKALERGPFVVENVRRIGNHVEVEIRYPRAGNRAKLISLD